MSHSFTKLAIHCIFSTKGRRQFIKPDLQKRLYPYIEGVLRNCNCGLLIAGGTADHVHLLFELDANLSIADAMRLVKTNSSKWIRETMPEQRDFAWQTGYAAFSVSASAIEEVTRYIANQDQHHRTRTFEEEFSEFVRRHGFKFDARDYGE